MISICICICVGVMMYDIFSKKGSVIIKRVGNNSLFLIEIISFFLKASV